MMIYYAKYLIYIFIGLLFNNESPTNIKAGLVILITITKDTDKNLNPKNNPLVLMILATFIIKNFGSVIFFKKIKVYFPFKL